MPNKITLDDLNRRIIIIERTKTFNWTPSTSVGNTATIKKVTLDELNRRLIVIERTISGGVNGIGSFENNTVKKVTMDDLNRRLIIIERLH